MKSKIFIMSILFQILVLSSLYSWDFFYQVGLYNNQSFFTFDSPLIVNKDMAGISEGLTMDLQYQGSIKIKQWGFTFMLADTGKLQAETNAQLTNRVTELYLSYNLFGHFIDVGKKKITKSMSFFKTPMDFALVSAGDLTKAKEDNELFAEGTFMVNLELFTDIGVFAINYAPKIDFTNEAIQYFSQSQIEYQEFRYSHNFGDVDTGLAVFHSDIWQAGINTSVTIGNNMELHLEGVFREQEGRTKLISDTVTIATSSVVMYSNVSETLTNRFDFVVGGSYIFKYFTVMAEYYFNHSGYNQSEWNGIRNIMRDERDKYDDNEIDSVLFEQAGAGAIPMFMMMNPEGTSSMLNLATMQSFVNASGFAELCHHYLMLRFSHPNPDKWDWSLVTIMNLQDASGMELLAGSYLGWEHLKGTAKFAFCFGPEFSEFIMMGQKWEMGIEFTATF